MAQAHCQKSVGQVGLFRFSVGEHKEQVSGNLKGSYIFLYAWEVRPLFNIWRATILSTKWGTRQDPRWCLKSLQRSDVSMARSSSLLTCSVTDRPLALQAHKWFSTSKVVDLGSSATDGFWGWALKRMSTRHPFLYRRLNYKAC